MITLGIDCGTQSTKCIAMDWETGTVLASAQQPYDFVSGLPAGHLEHHPEDWTAAAATTISAVLDLLGERRREVRAIGVSAQQHGLVLLDANGKVVRPCKLWCDTSTDAQCEAITRELGGVREVVHRVGNAMLPGYTAPKIRWVFENEPNHWKAAHSVLLPHDYLNFWLSGTLRMEYGDASGTALLDVRTRRWADEIFPHVAPDLRDKLPPLASSLEPCGELREELRKEWRLAEGVIISAGGGDNMMGAIGTGNVRKGVVTVSLGTSGTLYAWSAEPIVDPHGEIAAFCDSTDAWLPLACTMNVTFVTEQACDLFGWDHERLDAELRRVPAGCDGLVMLPYFCGERTPSLPDGRGVLFGLNRANFTPAHLVRVAVESVTLGLGYGLQRFRELGISPTEIRLTGGGSNSPAWRQICADVFGLPVVRLTSAEGSALGAAIHGGCAAAGTKVADEADRLVAADEKSRAEPAAESVRIYREALEKTNRLREAVAPLF